MKKVLFSLLTMMLIFTSCGADAVKFNDTIVKEQVSLQAPFLDYCNKFGQAIATNSVADIKPLGDDLLKKIDANIEVIKGLSAPSGGEKFKDVAIEYFESAKKIVTLQDQAGTLGDEPTEEQATAFTQEFNEVVKDMTEKEAAFHSAQKEFAKEKGMKLQ
ncbi:MAG: hypothetical protein ACK5M3_04730 [Dysgonomonas sp.]